MRNYILFLLTFGFAVYFSACNSIEKKAVLADEKMQFVVGQFENVLSEVDDSTKFPRTIMEEGKLRTTGVFGWTSGFFPGSLWYLYEITGDSKWQTEAVKWTEALAPVQFYTADHDVGFMINCSYGNGLRFADKTEYEEVIMNAAQSLSTRYNPVAKIIKSWNYKRSWDGHTEWFYPVIIDNMMNLELLFEATRLSGDNSFKDIAVQHALTTMENHYRDDFSCFHVVNYDTITGTAADQGNNQGFADESAWARGQAWGLYGFTTCYRYTKDEVFLKFAENIADFILEHPNLPEDMVPYWDFNVGEPGMNPKWGYDASKFTEIPRDASAAAIICSALFELGTFSVANADRYFEAASTIFESLSSPAYMNTSGNNNYFILNHSVGSIPHGVEIDVPLVYADYYFLEALYRKMNL